MEGEDKRGSDNEGEKEEIENSRNGKKGKSKEKEVEVSNKELRMESRRWIWNETRSWKENEEDE